MSLLFHVGFAVVLGCFLLIVMCVSCLVSFSCSFLLSVVFPCCCPVCVPFRVPFVYVCVGRLGFLFSFPACFHLAFRLVFVSCLLHLSIPFVVLLGATETICLGSIAGISVLSFVWGSGVYPDLLEAI